MKKWALLVGPAMILLGLFLLYFLVEGIGVGALATRGSEVERQTNPVMFWIHVCIYAGAILANLAFGGFLTKEAWQKLRQAAGHPDAKR